MISNSANDFNFFKLLSQKSKLLFFLILFILYNFNVIAQNNSLISDCDDFISGSNAWPYVLVATTLDDGEASQAAQTYTMNVTSLPSCPRLYDYHPASPCKISFSFLR